MCTCMTSTKTDKGKNNFEVYIRETENDGVNRFLAVHDRHRSWDLMNLPVLYEKINSVGRWKLFVSQGELYSIPIH